MTFGQKLRRLREKKGFTQQQLAEKLGYVTNSYISDVESGRFRMSREFFWMFHLGKDLAFICLGGSVGGL